MKYFLLLLTSFSCLICFCQNQKKVDSLIIELTKVKSDNREIDLLNEIFKEYFFISKDSAMVYANLAFEKASKTKYFHGIQLSCRNIAALHRRDVDYEAELKILVKGAELLKKLGNEPELIQVELTLVALYQINNNQKKAKEKLDEIAIKTKRLDLYVLLKNTYLEYAYLYYAENDFENSIKYFIKVDSILTKHKLSNGTQYGRVLVNLGTIKSRLGEFDQALSYFEKAISIYQKLNRKSEVFSIKKEIGINEIRKKNYKKAIVYLKEAYDFFDKNDYTRLKNTILTDLGDTYLKLEQFENAEKIYKEQYDFSVKRNDSLKIAESYIGIGTLNFKKNNIKESIKYFEKAKAIAESLQNLVILKRTFNGLSESYLTNHQYEKAAITLKKYLVINDSLTNVRNKKVSIELETKYQTEKKEQEIVLLKSEKELNEQKQNNQRNVMLGVLGITTIAGVFLFFLFRNRQKTNNKLKELDKAKSNFFANISHEFRTPLTLIANPIDDALEDATISDKKREQFVMAKRNSDRLIALVNQLLDLSKIDAGQLKLHIQKGNIQNLISGIAESFHYSAKQNDIDYHLNIENNNEYVWFDKDALEKTTINLLSNAIKYTPKNGTITCKSFIKNEKLYLNVKNTGIGITKNEIDNIFTRFYQTDEQNNGTGIGLALVKELIELHKGTITVESRPDEWISFSVILPVNKSSFKNEAFIDSTEIESDYEVPVFENTLVVDDVFEDNDKPILLIVEDNNDVRTLLKQTFEADYNILTAENGQVGIDVSLEHIPDIIISDIMMPIKDGVALTKDLKNNELTSHIPIILLTAKAGDKNELKGLKIGADDYITKPFNSKLLKTKVLNLIDIRRKLQSRYSQEVILTPKDITVTNLDEQFLKKVQQVLETKLIEASFSVEDFSKAVGVSRMQLHRKIKALTGLSASEFVRSQRLKLAAELLKTSNINISQVGYSVGFNDHSYFAKCFKEVNNCTPTEFAKKHSGK